MRKIGCFWIIGILLKEKSRLLGCQWMYLLRPATLKSCSLVKWEHKFTAYCPCMARLLGKRKCGKHDITSHLVKV